MRFISLAPCCDNVAFSNFLDFSKKGEKSHTFYSKKKKRALSTHTHIIYIYRDTKDEKVESGDRGAEEENGLFRRRWKRRAQSSSSSISNAVRGGDE